VVPLALGACLLPAAMLLAWALTLEVEQEPDGHPSGTAAQQLANLATLAAQVERDVQSMAAPALNMARLEAKRAAVRGAMLVELELSRGFSKVGARNLVEPDPAAWTSFLQRVGLTSPVSATEGEVVVNAHRVAKGGAVPPAFAPFVVGTQGPMEGDGAVGYGAPVTDTGWSVVAVRQVKLGGLPPSLAALKAAAHSLDRSLAAVPRELHSFQRKQDALLEQVRSMVAVGLGMGLLCALVMMVTLRAHVMGPLSRVRTQLERLCAGTPPLPVSQGEPMGDLHAGVAEVARCLEEARQAAAAHAQRGVFLDHLADACRRAMHGDLTARPSITEGTEGHAAVALTHLLDAMEERGVRVKGQARRVAAALQSLGPSTPPMGAGPADTGQTCSQQQSAVNGLLALAPVLQTLSARLATLGQEVDNGGNRLVADELRRRSEALPPRAQALERVLTDLTQSHGELSGSTRENPLRMGFSQALRRAQDAAEDLAREAGLVRTSDAFPAVVAALRDLPPSALQDAMEQCVADTTSKTS
jgi:hypothetical protein